jgi:queuine/archaeosine tRNA-ribosyltransferase
MLEHTINKIEERLRKTESLNEGSKSELRYLLSTLKIEIADLSKTHNEQAESIAGFAQLSTHEATRKEKDPELLKLSVEGLGSSVRGFESSHPRLVNVVNAICSMLSDLGI